MAVGAVSAQALSVPLRHRRRVQSLTPKQLEFLRRSFAAVKAIGDDRGYEHHAGIHGLPMPIGCDNAHGTAFFLPWHRAYLYFFELALRDRVKEASLVWWDWRTLQLGQNPGIPPAFNAPKVGGAPNPLYSAKVSPLALKQGRAQGVVVGAATRRRPNLPGSPPLPTRDEVARVLQLSDFLDFSGQVEDLHDRVHVWVGGHMGLIPFAAFDPIFWAHHTMIDRLWRLWQLKHPHASVPAALLDQALPPFRMTVRQTLDTTALGYDYAEATSSAAVG